MSKTKICNLILFEISYLIQLFQSYKYRNINLSFFNPNLAYIYDDSKHFDLITLSNSTFIIRLVIPSSDTHCIIMTLESIEHSISWTSKY